MNQTQEKFLIQQLILNFIDIWQKNNVVAQNDQGFKKYQPQEKVHNSTILPNNYGNNSILMENMI